MQEQGRKPPETWWEVFVLWLLSCVSSAVLVVLAYVLCSVMSCLCVQTCSVRLRSNIAIVCFAHVSVVFQPWLF